MRCLYLVLASWTVAAADLYRGLVSPPNRNPTNHAHNHSAGRIKELINRGGEKISPLEVDSALLSHPAVAEAVSFGAPDAKYGEIVAAAVVLKEGALAAAGGDEGALIEEIRAHCAKQLSGFKVPGPGLLFVTEALPKGATGKVQRRHMPAAFLKETVAA